MDRVALDIETVSTVSDPDFSNPAHWIPFAVAVGHSSPSSACSINVHFRKGESLRAEADLFHDVIDWAASRCNQENRIVISYNGSSYDIPILRHRARILDDELGEDLTQRLYFLLDTATHHDLMDDMVEQKGYHVSLDDALSMHDIEAEEPEWNGEKVTGADMPNFGLELMSGYPDNVNSDLREVTRRYAQSDVEPLFELHSRLHG